MSFDWVVAFGDELNEKIAQRRQERINKLPAADHGRVVFNQVATEVETALGRLNKIVQETIKFSASKPEGTSFLLRSTANAEGAQSVVYDPTGPRIRVESRVIGNVGKPELSQSFIMRKTSAGNLVVFPEIAGNAGSAAVNPAEIAQFIIMRFAEDAISHL